MLLFFVDSRMSLKIMLHIYIRALIATSAMLLIYFLLNSNLDGSVWEGMKISKSALTGEYCELNQTDKFFHQTMNTYSNLIYFFLGFIVLQLAVFDFRNTGHEHNNRIQNYPLLSLLFGLCMIYLCFGSTFFHASMTWAGQRADMNGAYGIAIILFATGLFRRFSEAFNTVAKRRWFSIVVVLMILFFLQVHVWVPIYILIPFVVSLVILITAVNYKRLKQHINRDLLYLSALFTAAAALFRTLDVMKIACDPVSVYQGHVLWHFFIGMAAFFLYWFYRSEKTAG
jgi:hypothetical protein